MVDGEDGTIGKALYDAGWHQGAILGPTLMQHLLPQGTPTHFSHAVVIAQDCNIVNDDREDRIEVMLGYDSDEQKGTNGFAQGRNPRLYRTGTTESSLRIWDVRERFTISKSTLSSVVGNAVCDDRLMDTEIHDIRKWIGRRYTRPAFPDAFNARFSSAKKEISKIVDSKEYQSVRGVYFLVTENDEELPGERDYTLKIAFCYVYNGSDDPLSDTKTKIDQYVSAVKKCAGIKIAGDPLILSDADFPIAYLDKFFLYDYDAHSYGDPVAAPPQQ